MTRNGIPWLRSIIASAVAKYWQSPRWLRVMNSSMGSVPGSWACPSRVYSKRPESRKRDSSKRARPALSPPETPDSATHSPAFAAKPGKAWEGQEAGREHPRAIRWEPIPPWLPFRRPSCPTRRAESDSPPARSEPGILASGHIFRTGIILRPRLPARRKTDPYGGRTET